MTIIKTERRNSCTPASVFSLYLEAGSETEIHDVALAALQ